MLQGTDHTAVGQHKDHAQNYTYRPPRRWRAKRNPKTAKRCYKILSQGVEDLVICRNYCQDAQERCPDARSR
jgi:hypothetical protein